MNSADHLRPVWVVQARVGRKGGFSEDEFIDAMGGDELEPEIEMELRLLWRVEEANA